MEALALGASQPFGDSYRNEVCDGCMGRVWLARPVQDTLDEEEDAGRPITLLCHQCALARLGPDFAEMIAEQRTA